MTCGKKETLECYKQFKEEASGHVVELFLKEEKGKKRRGTPPSSYDTMLHYFPTELVDIVRKIKPKKRGEKMVFSSISSLSILLSFLDHENFSMFSHT